MVIVQGEYKGQRTLDAIDYYLKHSSKEIVILSTWEGTVDSRLDERLSDRFVVVRSPLPPGPGRLNRHLQRHSTYAGVVKALELGATHVLKTRTDQLLRRVNVCEFLHDNLKKFGEDRLIVGHAGTYLHEIYGRFHIGDFWMFGRLPHFLDWYDTSGIDTTKDCFRPNVYVPSPEPDFCQMWMIKTGLTYSDLPKLLAEKFIVMECIDVELVFKLLPLDVDIDQLRNYWEPFGGAGIVRHSAWKIMFESRTT